MSSREVKTSVRWLGPVLWGIAALIVLITAVAVSPTAREVLGESALTIFQIFTSPFVLEISLAILGLCLVLGLNHRRRQREGDEWVYLQKQEPAPADPVDASDPPHRHEAVLWTEKPESFDEAGTELEVIEGYLDLGLADEAHKDLTTLPADLRESERACTLMIRALVMSGQAAAAVNAFEGAANTHPERMKSLSAAAFNAAMWLHENKSDEAQIAAWLGRCRRLNPRMIDTLPAHHPLRAFPAN